MDSDTDLEIESPAKRSLLRLAILPILIVVMLGLGGMLYVKHQRERAAAAAAEQPAPPVEETKNGLLIAGVPSPKGTLGDPNELDGEYSIVRLVRMGKSEMAAGTVSIRNAQFQIPGEDLPYTIKVLDKAKPPFECDLYQTIEAGKRFTQGLYKQEGDTLTFSLAVYKKKRVSVSGVGMVDTVSTTPRPAGFDATSDNLLVELKKK
jgi:hypothetical protein